MANLLGDLAAVQALAAKSWRRAGHGWRANTLFAASAHNAANAAWLSAELGRGALHGDDGGYGAAAIALFGVTGEDLGRTSDDISDKMRRAYAPTQRERIEDRFGDSARHWRLAARSLLHLGSRDAVDYALAMTREAKRTIADAIREPPFPGPFGDSPAHTSHRLAGQAHASVSQSLLDSGLAADPLYFGIAVEAEGRAIEHRLKALRDAVRANDWRGLHEGMGETANSLMRATKLAGALPGQKALRDQLGALAVQFGSLAADLHRVAADRAQADLETGAAIVRGNAGSDNEARFRQRELAGLVDNYFRAAVLQGSLLDVHKSLGDARAARRAGDRRDFAMASAIQAQFATRGPRDQGAPGAR
jgi:hypothetical protein